MALTHTRASEVATAVKGACDDLKAALKRAAEVLDTNSDLSVDWAGDPKPSYLNEDADGNLDGFKFTRAQVANAIGSLNQFRNLLTNQVATQGDHLGNLNLLADVES